MSLGFGNVKTFPLLDMSEQHYINDGYQVLVGVGAIVEIWLKIRIKHGYSRNYWIIPYVLYFAIFIAVGIIYSVISFIVRLFRAEEKAVKQTKRVIWLIGFSIFVFCLFLSELCLN